MCSPRAGGYCQEVLNGGFCGCYETKVQYVARAKKILLEVKSRSFAPAERQKIRSHVNAALKYIAKHPRGDSQR